MQDIEIRRGWTQGNDTVEITETIDGDDLSEIKCDPTLLAGEADQEVLVMVDVSQLVALLIQCDENVTIKVNNPNTPAATLTRKANKSLIWSDDCGFECPLTVDVTALYVTHSGTTAPKLKMRFASDPTPASSSSSG